MRKNKLVKRTLSVALAFVVAASSVGAGSVVSMADEVTEEITDTSSEEENVASSTDETETAEETKPSDKKENTDKSGLSTGQTTIELYEGMEYRIPVYKLNKKGEVAKYYRKKSDYKDIKVTSTKKKIVSVNKEGILVAKKAGTAEVKISSKKLNPVTVKVKVLKIPSLKGKKFVRESKLSEKADWKWPMCFTYKKKDTIVKKGIVEANKKYDAELISIVTYKVKGKNQYAMKYKLLDKNGNKIESAYDEIVLEEWLGIWSICSDIDFSRNLVSRFAKQKKFELYSEASSLSVDNKTLNENGWRNLCG